MSPMNQEPSRKSIDFLVLGTMRLCRDQHSKSDISYIDRPESRESITRDTSGASKVLYCFALAMRLHTIRVHGVDVGGRKRRKQTPT